MPPSLRLLATALLGAALTTTACGGSGAEARRRCADPGAGCTLAETARAAGRWVGAAVPVPLAGDELEAVATHFTSLTAENAMKWGALAPRVGSHDFADADALLATAEEYGLRLRGHVLVWGKFPGSGAPIDLAEVLAASPDPRAALTAILEEHVTTTVSRWAGRVETWDVVNEPLAVVGPGLHPNVFSEVLGVEHLDVAFRAARAADPGARLFLNEFFLVYDGVKTRAFLDLLRGLQERGVPLDGVGVQTHAFAAEPDDAVFRRFLARVAALGLQVELTEVDVSRIPYLGAELGGADLATLQAGLYGRLVDACLDLEACVGVTFWGISDRRTWLDDLPPSSLVAPNRPLLLDADLRPKPAYDAVRAAYAAAIP